MTSQQMQDIKQAIVVALRENKSPNEMASKTCLPAETIIEADILLQKDESIAELSFLPLLFKAIDPECKFNILTQDGTASLTGTILPRMKRKDRSILAGEQTSLNLLQNACSIATLTSEYINKVKGYNYAILNAHKTIPTVRALAKYVVKIGSGENQIFNLQEPFLIKKNHIQVLKKSGEHPNSKIEIEVDSISTDTMKVCARRNNAKAYLESSGETNKKKLKAITQTCLGESSIKSLTHSNPATGLHVKVIK